MPALTSLKRSLAVATTVATAVLGGAMLMTATSASYATGQGTGNNGTVKIGDQDINDIPNNNPHQGCEFLVEWYGFDENATSTVNFELQEPTAGAGYSLTSNPAIPDSVDLEDDAPGGAGNDPDGMQIYKLTFTGEPQANQGYHVKLSIDTNDSNGADSKYKVFWVEGCTPPTPSCPTVTVTNYVPTTVWATTTETTTIPASTQTTTKTETVTETTTAPGQTVTTTIPGQTVTQTVTQPADTVTVTQPGQTVTLPGQTVTQTVVNTITLPPVTETITAPGTTVTTTLPGETVTVTNTVTVAPSQATSTPTDDTSTEPTQATGPTDDTSVRGAQAEQAPADVPNVVAAGAEGPASPVPGGNKTLMFLALLVATLGAGLVGASVASKRQS